MMNRTRANIVLDFLGCFKYFKLLGEPDFMCYYSKYLFPRDKVVNLVVLLSITSMYDCSAVPMKNTFFKV